MAAPQPASPVAPQNVRRAIAANGESTFPESTTRGTPAPLLFQKGWQVGGIFQAAVNVAIPGLTGGQSEIVSVPPVMLYQTPAASTGFQVPPPIPSQFPSSIVLGPGQTAFVLISTNILPVGNSFPPPTGLIGMPFIQVTYQQGTTAGGTASAASVSGSQALVFGPATYTLFAAVIRLPIYAISTFAATTLALNVSAVLFGAAT